MLYDASALIMNGFHDYYQSGEDWLADFARFAAIGRSIKDLRGCFAALASKDYSADERAFIWVEDFAFDFLLPKHVLQDAFAIMRDNVGLKPMVSSKQYNDLQKISGCWRSWRR